MLKLGYKLCHKGFPSVYVVGNAIDVEFEKIPGKLAWRVTGGGTFRIFRVRFVQSITMNNVELAKFQFALREEELKDPVLIMAKGGILEIKGHILDVCRHCYSNTGVVEGLCLECGKKAGKKLCKSCRKWIASGGVCDCESKKDTNEPDYPELPRWMYSHLSCQFGLCRGECETQCRYEEVCFNCPWLGDILAGKKLTLRVMTDIIAAYSTNGIAVVLYNGSLRPFIPLSERKKIMARAVYLMKGGYMLATKDDLRSVGEFLEARTSPYEKRVIT